MTKVVICKNFIYIDVMRRLSENIQKSWGTLMQVYRAGEVAIYKVQRLEPCGDDYEVIKVRVHQPTALCNEPFEVYPCAEEFGCFGWSCNGLASVSKVLTKKLGFSEAQAQEVLTTITN